MALTDAQRAYFQLKERIVTTDMLPGAVIQIGELMVDLGLGRTPIREALKLLEAEKLVNVSPRRGIFVADISMNDLLQVHEIRMELETLCAGLVVERITANELKTLRSLIHKLDEAGGQDDHTALLKLDRRLHIFLAQASHNRLLQSEIERLYDLSQRIWNLCVNEVRPGALAGSAFKEILAAIETSDATHARRAMRAHILLFHESIKEAL